MTEAPILRIDLSSSVPAYRQIAGGIRTMLVAGGFGPGDLLPTIRQLATDLGLHPNTVAEAYRLLAEEGWVDLRRRTGAVVLDRRTPRPARDVVDGFARRIDELVAEAVAAGVPARILSARLSEIVRGLDSTERHREK
jgi:DNA-binding transcriptional regulator YhcF (GntR family)